MFSALSSSSFSSFLSFSSFILVEFLQLYYIKTKDAAQKKAGGGGLEAIGVEQTDQSGLLGIYLY